MPGALERPKPLGRSCGPHRPLGGRHGTTGSYSTTLRAPRIKWAPPPLPLGIGRGPAGNPKYNDVEVQHDEAALRFLLDNGLDAALAAHVAHQLVRDPLVLYRETMDQGVPGRAWSGLVRERGRGGGLG